MYGDIFHLCILTLSLFQNILARYDVIESDIHFKSLLYYTFVDIFFLFKNSRRYSIFIHHLHTIHLLKGALNYHPKVNCLNLVILEVTTIFNVLNRLLQSKTTLILRNYSWVIIRLILLPILVVQSTKEIMNYNYDIFLSHSYSYISILILSFEWSREILKIRDVNLSRGLLIIPLIDSLYRKKSVLRFIDILTSSYILNSAFIQSLKTYENKLIANTLLSYVLTNS